MVGVFANSGDPNQMPHSAESDLGLHCLPIILLGLQWVTLNYNSKSEIRLIQTKSNIFLISPQNMFPWRHKKRTI